MTEIEEIAYKEVAELDKLLIMHSDFTIAYEGIMRCVKMSQFTREPVGCMLLGDGGMGKTSLARAVIQMMQRSTQISDDLEADIVPAFYTSFKSSRNLGALTSDILGKLNDPYPDTGTATSKARRVTTLLQNCQTKILLIDELHDLQNIKSKRKEDRTAFLQWLKEICNDGGPAVCLMGIPTCQGIFGNDIQMNRRFKNIFFIRELTPAIDERKSTLSIFLKSAASKVLEKTSITSVPPLHSHENSLRVYAACSGNLDYTMSLIKQTLLSVLLEGRTTILLEDFANTWDSGLFSATTITVGNPFLMPKRELEAALRSRA